MSLGRDIAGGAAWTVAGRFAMRSVGVVSTLILARILAPDDFGLIAQAILVIEILQTATELGVQIPLIQNQNATKAHYNTAWTLKIIRGFLFAFIVWIIAEPVATWFDEPRLVSILYVVAFIPLIQGFQNIGVVDFWKYFRFHKEFQLNLTTKLIGFVSVIVLAYIWESYWAFVVSNLVVATSAVIFSFVLSPYRPKLDLSEWRYLIGFSKWIWLHEVANAFNQRIDIIALSLFFKTGIVGVYQVGRDVGAAPGNELSKPISRALFPGLTKLAGDLPEFRRMHVDVIAVSQVLALPAAVGVSVLAEPLTLVLLGEKWSEAIPFIKYIALWAFMGTFSSYAVVAFNAIGRTDMTSLISVVSLFVRLPVVFLSVFLMGAVGAAIGMLVAQVIHVFLVVFLFERFNLFDMQRYILRSWRTIAATLIMALVLTYAPFGLESQEVQAWLSLLLLVLLGVVVFFLVHVILWLTQRRPDGPEQTLLSFLKGKYARDPAVPT